MLRQLAGLTALLGVLLLAVPAAHAAEIEVRLTGGSVTGTARGQGTATVQAQVVNHGASALTGIRLGVYYSTTDTPPGAGADWREHEFVFEPPLAPGAATSLSFTDEHAAEYIALEVRYTLFADGGAPVAPAGGKPAAESKKQPPAKPQSKPSPPAKPQPKPATSAVTVLYRGMPANPAAPLVERDGAVYISTRDLLDCAGGSLSYDAATYQVVLERKGRKLAVKTGERAASADGAAVELAHSVLDIDGRSYVPLLDVAAYLNLTAAAQGQTITLEDAQ
jgi:hypothetical protein